MEKLRNYIRNIGNPYQCIYYVIIAYIILEILYNLIAVLFWKGNFDVVVIECSKLLIINGLKRYFTYITNDELTK